MSQSIVFLMSHPRHARMWRRFRRLAPDFSSTQVLAFDRTISTPATHGPYQSLGNISNRNYFRRIAAMAGAFRKITGAVGQSDVAYCFSLDLLFLAWVARLLTRQKVRLAYEVADIRDLLAANSWAGAMFRTVERFLVRRCAAVVFTSPQFFEGYFQESQNFTDFPHVVIEHKPEVPRALRETTPVRTDLEPPTVIGYFGLMKSPRSFEILTRLAQAGEGRITIVFRGIFVPPLDSRTCIATIDDSPNMRYDGPYKSPDDLPEMYASVDWIWDAYNETRNSRWQRTTRFSEAVFFKRPLLVNPDTQDGRLALELGVGMGVDLNDLNGCMRKILTVTNVEHQRWIENLQRVPEHLLFLTDEYDRLAGLLGARSTNPAPTGVVATNSA